MCALSVTPRCPHVPGPRGRELPGCWWGPGPGGPYPWEGPWALSPAPGPGHSGSPESGSPPPPRLWPIHWCLLTSDPPAGALSDQGAPEAPHSSGPPGLTGVAAGGGSCALGIPSLAGSTSWGSLLMGLNGRPFCATCLLKAAVCPESEADCVGTWVRLCSRVGEVCAISSGDPESRRGVPRPGGPSGE